MSTPRPMTLRKAIMATALVVYLVGLGMVAGVALDRMRFDRQRAAVIGRYEQALRELRMSQMSLEKRVVEGRQP